MWSSLHRTTLTHGQGQQGHSRSEADSFYYLRMTFDLIKVDKSFMMIGNGKMMMSWGTCETGQGCLDSHLLRSGPDHLVSITACSFYEIKS